MKFESLSINKNGDFYCIYSLPSPQKIHKNCKGKRELLIWGIPKSMIKDHLAHLLDDCDEN